MAGAGADGGPEGVYAQGGWCPRVTVVVAAVDRHSSRDLSQSGRVLVPLVSGDAWYSAGHQGVGWHLGGSWGLILGAQWSQHHRDLLRMGATYSLAEGEPGGLRKAVPSMGEE